VGIATVFAVVAAAFAVLLLIRDGERDDTAPSDAGEKRLGPAGGALELGAIRVSVPAGALDASAVLRIERTEAATLLAGATPASPVYEVSLSRRLTRPAEVSFRVPESARRDSGLAVAHGEHGPGLPSLLTGTIRAGRLGVRTRRLSPLQALDVSPLLAGYNAATRTSKAIYRALGPWLAYRSQPPSCDIDSQNLESVTDVGGDDPPIYARTCADRGRRVLKIVNNRAHSWEFPIPEGARVARVNGRGFSDTVWDEINKAYKSGWGLLPGAGSVTLEDVDAGDEVPLERELSTLGADVSLFVLSRGKSGALKDVADAVTWMQCITSLGNRASEETGSVAAIRLLLADCGGLLDDPGAEPPPRRPGGWGQRALENLRRASDRVRSAAAAAASVLGATTLMAGIVDAFSEGRRRVTVSVRRADQVIRLDGSGRPVAIGRFDIAGGDKFVADFIDAYGQPASRRGTGADDCDFTWSEPAIELHAATFSASPGGERCAPEVEFVQDVVIRSPLFRTESGVRVGMSVSEMTRLVPSASTRFTGQLYREEPVARAESTYRLAEIESPLGPTGKLVTLAAHVADGRVAALEVTPLLGGD
jgi:hypothetical protein